MVEGPVWRVVGVAVRVRSTLIKVTPESMLLYLCTAVLSLAGWPDLIVCYRMVTGYGSECYSLEGPVGMGRAVVVGWTSDVVIWPFLVWRVVGDGVCS